MNRRIRNLWIIQAELMEWLEELKNKIEVSPDSSDDEKVEYAILEKRTLRSFNELIDEMNKERERPLIEKLLWRR